uniref:Uncharacterized protein n=1 Tax=Arundo donax TaxID=35708 RepID=A0A0A8ZX48_ARUDO
MLPEDLFSISTFQLNNNWKLSS